MKNINSTIKTIAAAIIIMLLLFGVGYCIAYFKIKKKYSISMLNEIALLEQINTERNAHTKTIQLTKSQLEDFYGHYIDSLNKTHQNEKIRLKHVNGIIQMKLEMAYEEIKILSKDSLIYLPGRNDTLFKAKTARFTSECLDIPIYYPEGADYFLISPRFNISIDVISYMGNRSRSFKIFNRNIFRFGKRNIENHAFTTCGDSLGITIRSLEVVKK